MPSATLASTLANAVAMTRFLGRVPGLLRHPITPVDARTLLQRRLEDRERRFLLLVERASHGGRTSPYRWLMRAAGCELGDVERMVYHEGPEGALAVLFRAGVYLSLEEFKGRQRLVRGSATLETSPTALANPFAAAQMPISSGGSRGPRTQGGYSIAFMRDRVANLCLVLTAHGTLAGRHALWEVPGGAALLHQLDFAGAGARVERWFSQLEPTVSVIPARYRWSSRALRYASLLSRVPLPAPSFASIDDPGPVVDWLAAVPRGGQRPQLYTMPSSAVRLCREAELRGLDLAGASFILAGEPITAARRAAVERSGAVVAPRYSAAECGIVGEACLAPTASDDIHPQHDLLALIQPGEAGSSPRLPASALLVTALHPRAPFMLLNVSLGDQAELSAAACGCPLEQLGWRTHLRTIRSFEKLTAGGLTFLDSDIGRILDVDLPRRFGGGPTDYQLLEEELGGSSQLRLLIDPTVGPLDGSAVVEAFLAAIGGDSAAERVMALQWQRTGLVRVERRRPLATANSKILHLHRSAAVAEPATIA